MNREAKTYTHDERQRIIRNMQAHGGGFAYRLAAALAYADLTNTRRIEQAFPELLEKYAAGHWQ